MAITRAQIPEQIDVFDEGGGVENMTSSLTPEDIIALYGAQTTAPITAADVQAQVAELSGLFPEPKKQNFFDLASEVGAGLVAGATSLGGFGVGLSAGLQSFNERAKKIQAEKDAIKQKMAMFAYQQVDAKRKEQAETSNEVLKMQFKAALEGKGGVDFGSSERGKALAFIAAAERNPSLKTIPNPENPGQMIPNPDYTIAVLIAKQERVINTDTGSIRIPGIDIEAIFPNVNTLQPRIVDGVEYKPVVGETEKSTGKQIYMTPDGKKVVLD
jgi:hypothetical protein